MEELWSRSRVGLGGNEKQHGDSEKETRVIKIKGGQKGGFCSIYKLFNFVSLVFVHG